MPSEREQSFKVVWHQVALTERFSSVLYPLDTLELLRQLPAIGYIVPELLMLRGIPEEGKPLATKGDVELIVDMSNKTIGVRGRDLEKTIGSYQELRGFWAERLDPSPGMATQYLEFDGQGWAKADASPTTAFSNFWAKHGPLQDLGKLVDADVTNFGLQLAPPNRDPNAPDWFHIYIEPLIVSSNKRYRIRWIWRSPQIEEVLNKVSKIEETLRRILLRVEA